MWALKCWQLRVVVAINTNELRGLRLKQPMRHRRTRLPDWAKEMPIGLLSAAVGALKFGHGSLLHFRLLSETSATNLDDLRRRFDRKLLRLNVAKPSSTDNLEISRYECTTYI